MSGTGSRFYDDNEAEEILRLAARDGGSGRLDKERLLSMAAELGITPEAVERAESELVLKKESDAKAKIDADERAEYRKHRRSVLWGSVGSYVSVCALVVAIWFFTGYKGGFWPFWVIFPWGFGVAPQFFRRSSERDFERWRRRRRGETDPQAINESTMRAVLDELASRGETDRLSVIRELRVRTGVQLSVAKEAVDEYAAEHDDVVW